MKIVSIRRKAGKAFMRKTLSALLAGLACLAFALPLTAAEYFVSRDGDDSATGLSPESAFASIARGISRLGPGDTLTIMPGQYFESVTARLAGEPEAPITVRAKHPGTVLLRGDLDVSGFQPIEGSRYTWWLDFEQRAQGVADRAAMRLYDPVISLAEVEQAPGSFYQDPETGRLFVHASSSLDPGRALSVSVTDGFGILLTAGTRDLVIDGLSFTGYNSRDLPPEPGSRARWGLHLVRGERVTIRRCTAFLNSGGIYLLGSTDCLVEECRAFHNESRYLDIGNNIMGWGGSGNIFRRNFVEGGSSTSLTFYSGAADAGGRIEDNTAFRTGIMIKGGFGQATQERNIVIGSSFYRSPDPSNILISTNRGAAAERNFADPLAHDYRLQAGAPLRGTGPGGADPGPAPSRGEVFFVSPEGDDANPGSSLDLAWRTLARAAQSAEAGQTVYVTAGTYREALKPARSGEPGRPVEFRRRGMDRVVLEGEGAPGPGIDLSGRSHVLVSGLAVRGFAGDGVTAGDGEGIALDRLTVSECGGAGVSASNVHGFSLARSHLRDNAGGGLRLADSPGALVTGNILDRAGAAALHLDDASLEGFHGDLNAFPPAGRPAASLGGRSFASLGEWRAETGHDPSSIALDPGFRDPESGDFSLSAGSPLVGRGPGGDPAGAFLRVPVTAPVTVENIHARAIADTSAALECWTPGPGSAVTFEYRPDEGSWSEARRVASRAGTIHNIGLTGLEPGRQYLFRVIAEGRSAGTVFAPYAAEPAATPDPEPLPPDGLAFRTLPEKPEGRIFHVAQDGDDGFDGLSRTRAWRTLSRAASSVRAGDTVLVHEGTYTDLARLRGTGDEGAPITFRTAPGETVWLEGERTRSIAFLVENKEHVRIDGFRFRNFHYIPHGPPPVTIRGGRGHVISRCFYDGRVLSGYMPPFFRAIGTPGLVVENSVMIFGMGTGCGGIVGDAPGAVLRHNVFYNNYIYALDIVNAPDQEITLTHNLFCDHIPGKSGNPVTRIRNIESLRADHNGYFMRTGPERKTLYQAGLPANQRRLTLPVAQEEFGLEKGSLFGNPGIRAAAELSPPGRQDAAWLRNEVHREGSTLLPLDFADFFADPDVPFGRSAAGRPIGLDPAAFAD